jgi:hypothetical protein
MTNLFISIGLFCDGKRQQNRWGLEWKDGRIIRQTLYPRHNFADSSCSYCRTVLLRIRVDSFAPLQGAQQLVQVQTCRRVAFPADEIQSEGKSAGRMSLCGSLHTENFAMQPTFVPVAASNCRISTPTVGVAEGRAATCAPKSGSNTQP